MGELFYFVGKFGEVGHEDAGAGKEFIAGYPVFFTYDKSNKRERHNSARFVHSDDAKKWTEIMNED